MARGRGSNVGSTGEWNPLSFRQLAALLAIFMTGVVLFPVGVQAAGQLVSIVDSDSDTDQVQVDAGKLRMGDGSGPFTVDGNVQTELPAGTAQNRSVSAGHDSRFGGRAILGGRFLPGDRFAIGSITLYGAIEPTILTFRIRKAVNGNCSSSGPIQKEIEVLVLYPEPPPPSPPMHLAFPIPLTLGLGTSWCLYAHSGGGQFFLTVVGQII